jgi:acetyl esterase
MLNVLRNSVLRRPWTLAGSLADLKTMIRSLALLIGISGFTATAAPVTLAELLRASPTDAPVYRMVDGRALHLHRFAPDGLVAGDSRPAVVWIHGGAWRGGSAEVSPPHARYFATRGAVGFSLEYRLISPAALTVADCVADCRAALAYLRAHARELGVDPARIAVGGDSAGGHLAAALATLPAADATARPDALLLYNPVLDLTEGNWTRFVEGGPGLAIKTTPPATPAALERARALSPVYHVGAGLPPVLLQHGLADQVVPASQAERFAAAAQAAGARCELRLLPGVAHAFVVPRYRASEGVVMEAVRAADRFLVSLGWLEGAPTLIASDPPAWGRPD